MPKFEFQKRSLRLRDYIRVTWKPNVTRVDLRYLHQSDDFHNNLDVGQDLRALAERLFEQCGVAPPQNASRLYDYAEPFFIAVAEATKRMRGRFVVEAVCGDVNELLDRVRNGYC